MSFGLIRMSDLPPATSPTLLLHAEVPLFGICRGAQLLAEALGGRVFKLPQPETGWTLIQFDDGGKLQTLQWHEDSFSLPAGSTLHASSLSASIHTSALAKRELGCSFNRNGMRSQFPF